MKQTDDLVKGLLKNPDRLRQKKPFVRGMVRDGSPNEGKEVEYTAQIEAHLPKCKMRVIPQEKFVRELNPWSHDVLFDENIPSFCVKLDDGNYYDVIHKKVSLPLQRIIMEKQVLHLTGNPMSFTMMETEPSETMRKNFIKFKQYWDLRNQDGMKKKFVTAQKSYGDAGLLYYHDSKGRIKSRVISFEGGYVLCPHNDKNGDRILESVYYIKDGVEYIDSYDERYMYRHTNDLQTENGEIGWRFHEPEEHGFDEIPLITKRGKVAWDAVQTAIDGYETLYNIFLVVQKRFGNGILYIKGKFKDQAQKIAGSIVLNDASMDGNGDAKFLTPPTPQNMIDTLQQQLEAIQLGAKTTFVLPKDIKTGGDLSGLAVQLTRELDIVNAEQAVIDWQNVADKMVRLFKQGLAKELVNDGQNPNAVTEFAELQINAKFKVWRPFNETEFNQMITTLSGAGVISKETAIEVNTISKPDEKQRIRKETEEAEQKALEQQEATLKMQAEANKSNEQNKGEQE